MSSGIPEGFFVFFVDDFGIIAFESGAGCLDVCEVPEYDAGEGGLSTELFFVSGLY